MRPRSAAVGVFDSGIGGLTVAKEVIRQLPHESVIYFGDTARVPYGPKSPETVRRYSREIAGFLRDEGVKSIVIACNTATAHALGALREEMDMPVIGVVEPGARAAVAATRGGHIGVIGTAGTIKSGAYERAIRALDPDVTITMRACPLFVPLVEEGWTDHAATRLVAREYLEPLVAANRHTGAWLHALSASPLLRDVLGRSCLIDSAEETAAETARTLASVNLAPTMWRIRVTGSSRPTIRYSFFSWANASLAGRSNALRSALSADPFHWRSAIRFSVT